MSSAWNKNTSTGVFDFSPTANVESTFDFISSMASRYSIFSFAERRNNNKMVSESFSPPPAAKSTPLPEIEAPKPKQQPKRIRNRPTIACMVDKAIFEKSSHGKGLSFVAVKKFLEEEYAMNIKRSARKIGDYIKECLQSGRFIQKTGRGLNGSFRLAPSVRTALNKEFGKRKTEYPKSNLSNSKERKRTTGSVKAITKTK